MASIDFSSDFTRRNRLRLLEYAALGAHWYILAAFLACLLIVMVAFSLAGQTPAGWRLASENIARFSLFFFLTAFAAGPAARLFPHPDLTLFAHDRHKLILAFAAGFAVSLLCLVAPYAPLDVAFVHAIPPTTLAYIGVSAGFLLLLIAGARAERLYAGRFNRFLDRLGLGYFWALFALQAVDHFNGPHRPDGFFGFSLLLLLAALLLRFADSFVARRPARPARTPLWLRV